MSQYLGDISAYALAVSQGYTGTEEEYAELMASYATVGQTAVDAKDAAVAANTAAQTAATTATTKASEATTAATTATTKAGEASTSASTATSAKDTAVSASQTATTKATEATTAAATATSAATTATTAKDDAVSAKTAAQTAQTGAETAAASVSASAAQIQTNADDISELKEDTTQLKSDFTANLDADMLNSSASFSSIKQVFDGDTTVPVKYYGAMQRGSATGGVVSASAKRCYCKMPLTTNADKIYFDDTKYNLNAAWFRNGVYASQSGWITSSPFTYTNSEGCDFAYITIRAANDTDVVDLDDASKTTYFQKTYSKVKEQPVAYVSSSGNNSNTGDKAHPLATVNAALERGAERIFLIDGDYRQQIDLSKSETGKVEILKASETGRVFFRPATTNLATSETKVDGTTKVYSASIAVTLEANNKWIFQRNVSDANTLISDAERMPQQRGYMYRLSDTIIKKCLSDNLNDALAEIDASGDYLWYADNGTLYFSRPNAVSNSTPIGFSSGLKLFLNNSDNNTVIMTGIDVQYMSINIDNTVDSVITDCSASFVYGDGAFTYNYALNAKFIRCEAAATFNGTIGDGFNAHGKTGGAAKAHKTTGMLIDCWSHDNNDDGFSDHECCESEIYGGLFEYNGKGGITPSYGSHCKCSGVYSRHNYNGFYYTGAASAAEGGQYGQLECIDCVSEENTRGTNQGNSGYLVESTGNKLILINCKSINNSIGYYATSNTSMKLIDCGSFGDATIKTGGGTREIVTTALVSA